MTSSDANTEDFFAPSEAYLWDFWTLPANELWHLFHLQAPRQLGPDERHHQSSIGHAISADLCHWQSQGTLLTPGPEPWDNLALWTGSVVTHQQRHYLFYTGRSRETYHIQKIGLAISDDLKTWQKHPQNPLLEADLRFYQMEDCLNPLGVFPAWRDPYVFRLSETAPWQMLLTARQAGSSQSHNGCIARAESWDLLHWEVQPPLLAPGWYDEMEVPQLIVSGGLYYLFFSTWSRAYLPEHQAHTGAFSGLHAFWAPSYEGPYAPVNGNGVVLAGEELYAIRLIKKELKRKSQKETQDRYTALGFLNQNHSGQFIGRLSAPFSICLEGERVWREEA